LRRFADGIVDDRFDLAALLGDLPGDVLSLHPMLGTGVASVCVDHYLTAVQQVLGLRYIRCVRRRRRDGVRQPRFHVDANVGLHPEVPLVALLGLVHLRIARVVGVLRRTR
jgi:hypothetical protein